MSVSPRISVQSASATNTNASIALHKPTISNLSVESAENKPISVENPSNSRVLRLKRVRKASQNAQFLIHQDEISFPDSPSSKGYEGSSPVDSGAQTESTRPNVVVEIPFWPEIHYKRGSLYLSESLHPNTTNRWSRAKSIPKKWTKNQSNDHTSEQKQSFYLFLVVF